MPAAEGIKFTDLDRLDQITSEYDTLVVHRPSGQTFKVSSALLGGGGSSTSALSVLTRSRTGTAYTVDTTWLGKTSEHTNTEPATISIPVNLISSTEALTDPLYPMAEFTVVKAGPGTLTLSAQAGVTLKYPGGSGAGYVVAGNNSKVVVLKYVRLTSSDAVVYLFLDTVAAPTVTSIGWANVTDKPTSFPPADHNHDTRYVAQTTFDETIAQMYTAAYVDTALAGKAPYSHNHNSAYYTKAEVDALITNNSGGSGGTPAASNFMSGAALRTIQMTGQKTYTVTQNDLDGVVPNSGGKVALDGTILHVKTNATGGDVTVVLPKLDLENNVAKTISVLLNGPHKVTFKNDTTNPLITFQSDGSKFNLQGDERWVEIVYKGYSDFGGAFVSLLGPLS